MRTLISAAALLALAGAAQAQVSIYGLIDASYGKSLLSDLQGLDADFHSGGDNFSSEGNSTTRIGFKGSYELSPSVKANFRLETGGITSDGSISSDNLFNRQAWFGFSGASWGEVRLGRQDSVAFQTMIDYDFNGASNGVSAGGYTGAAPWLPGRDSRSLQYISPSFGGFTVHAAYTSGEGSDNGENFKNYYSLAGKWASGPVSVAAVYESKRADAPTAGLRAKDFYSVAGSFDFGVAKVMASWADGGAVAAGGTGDGYMLGVVAPIAGFNIGAHYAENLDDNADVKGYELFINREIFKNTYLYGEYGNWDSGVPVLGKTKADGFAVGVIFVF